MNFDKHGQNMIKVKKRGSIINTVDNKYQPYLNL